jgi:hypothetical protein
MVYDATRVSIDLHVSMGDRILRLHPLFDRTLPGRLTSVRRHGDGTSALSISPGKWHVRAS